MTERQGLFPPAGTEDGTFHWLKPEHGPAQLYMWHIRAWFFPGQARGKDHEAMGASKFSYLGPAPTYEQSQANAADARRFRLIASLDHGGTREIRLSGVKRNGDVWGHGISWSGTPCHADIRAAIDASMKEKSNA